LQLTGIHHLTAVTADIRGNHRFYTQVLGMRLVKRSVNQDDVSAYHLFYADGEGSPGTDVTFFDWAVPREKRGTDSIIRTSLRVAGAAALEYWQTRLDEHKVPNSGVITLDERLQITFEDPEGQRLALLDDVGSGDAPKVWEKSPVPPEFQIRGLGPITLSVADILPTDAVLVHAMNFRKVREYTLPGNDKHGVSVYEMGEGGPSAELHVAEQPDLPRTQPGAGGVHHVAFRTPNDEEYHAWNQRLTSLGLRTSGEIDRFYFRSLYFREPNGILFEIATDGPGFHVDEDMATMGEKVALPPFLEGRRAQIEANLKPID
jgi:glyoxalase family protein